MLRIVVFLIAIMMFQIANSAEYTVDNSKKNVVKFISEAPVEQFEGVTEKIDGYFYSEKGDILNAEIYFEVNLNNVDTGIGLRNRHMREDYLHTSKYPKTTFKGKISDLKKISETELDVIVKGSYFLHGITKEREISGKIYLLDNGMKIKSEFVVKLTDHKIDVPKFMFMKISEDIKVYLDFIVKKVK